MSELTKVAVSAPRYSIVVPCYNEADSIVPLLDEIISMTAGDENYEIIIVDDHSNDETLQRLRAAREDPQRRFKIIAHTINSGQSAAVCSGVDAARGAWIATLDGDGQNDPADIPRLIEVLDEQTGDGARPIICGHRTARQDSAVKKFSSRIANKVRSSLLADDTPDTGCGLKLIHRESFLRWPRFDHMHRFLPALAKREGGYVVSVPVGHRARQAGQSKYGIHNRLWVGIIDLVGVIWLRRRRFKATEYEEI